MSRLFRMFLCSSVILLAACASDEHEDIKQWMQDNSRDLKGHVPPLPELKPFPIVSYDGSSLTDPFLAAKIVPERSAGSDRNTPDFDRPKEPLEVYPLESLKLVGVMLPGKGTTKTPYALIQTGAGLYYIVAGNHLGQNFGVVTAITESEIKIKETIKDPTGQTADWVDRPTSLYLEGAKK